jgi:non-homologous end joining protein Ku
LKKISFSQINKKPATGPLSQEVASEGHHQGYQDDTDQYLEVTKKRLEAMALESTRTIELDEFVPRKGSTISILRSRTISPPTTSSAMKARNSYAALTSRAIPGAT